MEKSQEVVIVTGGTGLVGTAIQTCVNSEKNLEKYKFIFLGTADGDLSSLEQTRAIFNKYKPAYIINLAAMVGGLFKNLQYNLEFFQTNMSINDNVLKMANEFKVKKCVSLLSTCIFPDKTTYPIYETMIHNGPPHDSNFGYAYAKRMIDVLNKAYAKHYEINGVKNAPIFTSAIPTNIYGINDNYNFEDSHVIPGLIHKAYKACEKAKADGSDRACLVVCGSGNPKRQFIFSEDLARLVIWMLFNYAEVDPIILSVDPEDEMSIGDVAKMISESFSKIYGLKCEIEYDSSYSDGQFKKTADNTKLRKYLPDFKFIDAKEGIDKSVKWFCENYKTARK